MQLNTAHIKKFIKQLWIWMVRKDVLIYLLFVGLVALFWWGRTMSSQREIDINLPITYAGIPTQVVIDSPLPSHIKVTLRDNGRVLRQVQHTKPTVTITLTEKFTSKNGKLLIPTEIIRSKIQDVLPGTTTIQQIHSDKIDIAYHIESTRSVPIKICAQWTLEEQYQLSAPPILDPAYVDIYGTQQTIDAIDSICTESIIIDRISNSVQKTLSLCVPEGVRIPTATTTVTWQAEQFTEKSFVIPIEIEGLPEGETMHLLPKETTVTIRVGIPHFTDVSIQDFRAVCQYPTQMQPTLPIVVTCNDPQITQVRTSIHEVEYIIER